MALTPLNTDSNNFPLSGSPFLSRVSTHHNSGKNYSMLSFNPGFALQAAELNEIQELFFMNLNLTQRMNANWIKLNTTQTTPFTAPYWDGLIPLDPNYLTIADVTYTAASNSVQFSYTLSAGWYLYTDPKSKLSFWAYNATTFSKNNTTASPSGGSSLIYFGTSTSTNQIGCCQTNDSCLNQDSTLRDGSQQSYQEFTCGASRFKVNINTDSLGELNSYFNLTSAPANFSHIFLVDLQSTVRSIRYPNGYIIQALT